MKKLLLLILLPFITFAQQQEMIGELRIALTNYGTSWDITFTLTAIGARWDANYYLTEDYETVSVNISQPDFEADFDHILDPSYGRNPEFAVGLYKISAIENGVEQAYFYMDWRTSDWSASLDVSFKYDVGNKGFRDLYDTQTIDYSYQTLWDLTGNLLVTSGLELYLTVSNQNDTPYLEWNEYHDTNILGYNVYRKVTTSSGSMTFVEFTTSTSYLDDDFEIDPKFGDDQVEYWIKAKISSTQESLEGNHVQLDGTSFLQWKVSVKESTNDLYYNLNQNYPNPFNPATIISFSVAENSFITLKVFDVLGKEVMTLINEMMEAGVHQVEFNGSGLKSGVYFYEIRAKNFRDVKKLILLK